MPHLASLESSKKGNHATSGAFSRRRLHPWALFFVQFHRVCSATEIESPHVVIKYDILCQKKRERCTEKSKHLVEHEFRLEAMKTFDHRCALTVTWYIIKLRRTTLASQRIFGEVSTS